MKKHYETHVEDTDKLISVAGPVLDYKSWYEQYRKLMEEQAQRKYGLYTPTSEGDDDNFPSIPGITARYSALGLTNEQMAENPVWKDLTGNGHDLQMKNFAWKGMSGVGGYGDENYQTFYKFTLDDCVFIASPPGVKHMNFTFRVTGLQPGNKLTLAFFGTTNTVYGICPRMNIDETEVLLHIEHYDVLFPPMMTLEEDDNSDIVYPFPTYDATSTEFNSLITSDEWSTNTKDYDI